jgi:hypothetical protein
MRVQLDMSSNNQTNIAPDTPYSMPDAQVPMSEDPPEMDELADNDVNYEVTNLQISYFGNTKKKKTRLSLYTGSAVKKRSMCEPLPAWLGSARF